MARKSNGEGSISFDAVHGSYRAFISDPNGKRISKRFKTKKEAVEWLAITKASIYKGDYIQGGEKLFGEWLLEYIDTYKSPNVRQSTLDRYRVTVKKLLPLARVRLKDLSPLMIQKFYNTLPADMSDSSIGKIHKLLCAAIRKAALIGLMKDLTPALELPKRQKQGEIEIFTVQEIRTLLATAKTDRYYQRYYPFIKLAVFTGARIGELLALKTTNVLDDAIKIDSSVRMTSKGRTTSPPKTAAGLRTITIPAELVGELRQAAQDYTYVFHTKDDLPWQTHNAERAWRNILKSCGLPGKHFHSLRHTHATQLLANGVPILEVAKRLGHSQASHTLNLYGHALKGYDKKIPDKVREIFEL